LGQNMLKFQNMSLSVNQLITFMH